MAGSLRSLGKLTCKFLAKHGFEIYDKDDGETHFIGYSIVGLLTVGAIGGPIVIIYRLVEKAIVFFESL